MANFAYKGRDSQGNATSGVVEAANEMAAAEQLMRRGVMPTELKPGKAKSAAIDWSLLLEGGVKLDELVIFSRQMYALTRAGIPILRAIAGLEESTHSKPLKRALHSLGEDLGNGRPLSSSMQAHPKVFSSLFVAIIHVGENTGQLEESFLQLANYFELELETRKRIKTAMRYPSFVMIAIGIAMVILNIMVIPVFAGMFAKFGVELPLATRILLATSHFFVNYWWLLLAILAGMVFGWRRWVATTKGKLTWHRWQLKLPIVGTIIERSLLARFAHRTYAACPASDDLSSGWTDNLRTRGRLVTPSAGMSISLNNSNNFVLRFDQMGRPLGSCATGCTLLVSDGRETSRIQIESEGYIHEIP